MDKLKLFIGIVMCVMLTTVPALATVNPSTGDNSIVGIIVMVMAATAVGLVVVLLLTRNKK